MIYLVAIAVFFLIVRNFFEFKVSDGHKTKKASKSEKFNLQNSEIEDADFEELD